MYLRIFEIYVLKYKSLILLILFPHQDEHGNLLDLFTDIDMILMIEKVIKGGICYSISWYSKADTKNTKGYDKKRNRHILNIGM